MNKSQLRIEQERREYMMIKGTLFQKITKGPEYKTFDSAVWDMLDRASNEQLAHVALAFPIHLRVHLDLKETKLSYREFFKEFLIKRGDYDEY